MSSTITNQRLLSASPSAVFDAFADPTQLAQRRGPKGFTNTFSQFDFTPGGKRVFTMHGPDGTDYPNESIFLEIEPNQKIVIHHIVQPIFTLTVTLEEKNDNQTLMTWSAEFESTAFVEQIRDFLIRSNEENFDRIEKVLAGEKLSMITLQSIQEANSKVKSGTDFPAYIQEIKTLGVRSYETFVSDGHAEYNGSTGEKIASGPKYDTLLVAETYNNEHFMTNLQAHQQGKTNFLTFCQDCARSGVEKRVMDLETMTCTYYDSQRKKILVEKIPG